MTAENELHQCLTDNWTFKANTCFTWTYKITQKNQGEFHTTSYGFPIGKSIPQNNHRNDLQICKDVV